MKLFSEKRINYFLNIGSIHKEVLNTLAEFDIDNDRLFGEFWSTGTIFIKSEQFEDLITLCKRIFSVQFNIG